MLKNLAELRKLRIHAKDGDIGAVHSFLFDDASWTVRYLVVETSGWLTDRQVLISPMAISNVHWDAQKVELALTKKQIEDSPKIATDLPITRQHEVELVGHYGWPVYWQSLAPEMPWYFDVSNHERLASMKLRPHDSIEVEGYDPHLHSTKSVVGYRIHTTDGFLGLVEGFVADDRSWMIRYMVIDATDQLSGKKVIVGINWIETINWNDREVNVSITKDAYTDCPEYNPEGTIDREFEVKVHEQVCKPKYWDIMKQTQDKRKRELSREAQSVA